MLPNKSKQEVWGWRVGGRACPVYNLQLHQLNKNEKKRKEKKRTERLRQWIGFLGNFLAADRWQQIDGTRTRKRTRKNLKKKGE